MGTQTSNGKPRKVPTKPGCATPTTVKGRPLIETERPSTDGSAPKRDLQAPSERTTTASRPGTASSAGPKKRPS